LISNNLKRNLKEE